MARVTRATDDEQQPSVGSVLAGRYLLEALIAKGGMGTVYRARDSFLNQRVAIKVLRFQPSHYVPKEIRKALDDLRNEARTSILLTHPNIVRTYNYERDHNWEFLVSELVDGEDLKTVRRRSSTGALSLDQVVRVGIQACAALEHARTLGVLHFDVKPANILLTRDGVAKLCDFGLSSLSTLMSDPNVERVAVGTPAFMSPEMVREQRADHRSDIYSLGATLFDLATGAPPFGSDASICCKAHVESPVEFPPTLHAGFVRVLRRALAKDPEHRYPTADAMRRELEALATEFDQPISLDEFLENEREGITIMAELGPSFAVDLALDKQAQPRKAAEPSTLEIATFGYDLGTGKWSTETFPAFDSDRTLVLFSGAPELIDSSYPIIHLFCSYPRAHVIGCSTAGEVAGSEVRDRSLSVAVLRFRHTRLASCLVEVPDPKGSFEAGQAVARQLSRPDLRGILVLSEGVEVNGSELVRGLSASLPEEVVVTGGMAGDGTRFGRTWVFGEGKLASKAVVAVGLYGDHVLIGHGSRGGWDEFGAERVITRAEANVVYEIDGAPALALYERYLGQKSKDLPASGLLFPLAMRTDPKDPSKFLVRTLLAVDRERQSLTFAGDIPVGSRVHLMKADLGRLVEGARGAGRRAAEILPTRDGSFFAFAVSCVGRRLVLGEEVDAELLGLEQVLPAATQTIGFYSYGEISPYSSGACDLHNQTMTVTLLGESPSPIQEIAREVGREGARENGREGAREGSQEAPREPADLLEAPGRPDEPRPAAVRRLLEVDQISYSLSRESWSSGSFPKLDSPRTLVLAFGAPEMRDKPEVFDLLERAYPRSVIVGCSGAGEILGAEIHDGSLAVTVARFTHTEIRSALKRISDPSASFVVGQSLAEAIDGPDLRAVLVLSDGLKVNGSDLARGLNAGLGDEVLVAGGLAGDGTRFESTWVYHAGALDAGMVVAVGLYGEHLAFGHGSKGGWDRFGPERRITRSKGNVLYEIDGEPALALYKRYLGQKASELPASGLLFPLSVRENERSEKYLVRTLLGIDETSQSMTFAGDVPEGHVVQLMKADFDRLIGGAAEAAREGRKLLARPVESALCVAISCVGRRLVLGDRSEEELDAVKEVLPRNTAVTGFYSYGELSPFATGSCDLHNQTMTLTVLGEVHEVEEPVVHATLIDIPPVPAPPGLTVERRTFDFTSGSWDRELPKLDSEQTLVLVFGPPDLDDASPALRALLSAYPRATIVGCSTSGEIHDTTVRDASLSVAIARFSKTRITRASVEVRDPRQSYAAGETLGLRLAQPDLRAVLVLSEGLGVNGSELVRGFNAVLDPEVVVTGGLAGDGTRFARTWVLSDGLVGERMVVAVGLCGEHVEVAHGSKGGWDMFGPQRTITRSEGNVLYEIDGEPALSLYKRYLGDKASELPASGLRFPLALRATRDCETYVVRTLLSVDEGAKSMTFAGDVPEGHFVQLMKADFDRLIGGAQAAAEASSKMLLGPGDGGPALCVAISCVGRRLVLGEETEAEVEAVKDALPPRTELVGFYSYGEISPFATGRCDLHNQTMTLTVVRERAHPVPRPTPTRLLPSRRSGTEASIPLGTPSVLPVQREGTRVERADAFGFEIAEVGGLLAARFEGRITETFDGRDIAARLAGRVVLDLSGVERVTSFGVREWLQMLKSMSPQVTEVFYGRCSDAIVNQMSMIPGFAGPGRLVSFFAPYVCDRCGTSFEAEIDVERDAAALRKNEVDATCPRCRSSATLDDDPSAYFAFATPFVGHAIPADVRRALESLRSDETSEVASVEKQIEGRTTTIRVAQPIDRTLRWHRILEGLEGDLVLDLGAAPSHEIEGLRLMLQALDGVSGEVESLQLVGVPQAFLELLKEQGRPANAIKSVILRAEVRGSGTPRVVRIELDEHRATLAAGREPLILDKKSNLPIDIEPFLPLLRYAVDAAPTATVAPRLTEAALRPPAPRWLPSPSLAAWAALFLAVAFLIVRELTRTPPEPPQVVVEAPKPPPPAPPPPVVLLAPPAWTELKFFRTADRIDLVGAGQGEDLPRALEVARQDALLRMAKEVLEALDTPHGAFLRGQIASRPKAETALRIEQKLGELVPERVEHWVTPESSPVEVTVRYRLRPAAFDALVERLRDTKALRGMYIGHTSPLMAGPLEGVLVYDVRPGSQAARAGLRPGDIILEVSQRGVHDPDGFVEVWKTQWWRTRPGQDIVLLVQGLATRQEVRFTRPGGG